MLVGIENCLNREKGFNVQPPGDSANPTFSRSSSAKLSLHSRLDDAGALGPDGRCAEHPVHIDPTPHTRAQERFVPTPLALLK